jgi:predicted AAA+ superfamily ATPase
MVAGRLLERGVAEDQMLALNFDSLEHEGLKTAERLYEEVRRRVTASGKTYLLLDEIQEVENWERAVNSFMIDLDVDVYVTGSNSRMMSSEISTYLTGRYIQIRVYPLAFSEYLKFRAANAEAGYDTEVRQRPGVAEQPFTGDHIRHVEFARYLRLGGFPAIHLHDYTVEEAYAIVRDIYNSTIYTDIVRRGQIRRVDQLERIVRFTFDNIGRTFSAASISRYLKSERRAIDNETVYSYLNKLEGAFIFHRCSRFDIQGKELLKTQEKYYVCDPAMRYSVLGYSQDSVAAMLENVVYLELLRRGYDVHVGLVPGGEIDFVATRQESRLYIQIAQRISNASTEEREYGRLLGIRDNHPKYVLSTDGFAGGNHEGIKTMHVADFLLSSEY